MNLSKTCDANLDSAAWRTRAIIDLAALRHNVLLVRKLADQCKIMAVVKSDAYGHGMACITHSIAELVDAFAVATLDEGIACRLANPVLPITVLSGVQYSVAAEHVTALEICRKYRLDPVIYTFEYVQWLAQQQSAPPTIWLKIDSGMNRLGIAPAQVAAAVTLLRTNRRIKTIRLMSHLANAEASAHDFTNNQLAQFQQATQHYQLERSLANSAAIANWPQTHFQWVRPGIMLYGGMRLDASGDSGTSPRLAGMQLKPVMQLEARLLMIKQIAAGQVVGYGCAFTATVPMRIGIVGFGYGDGYPWSLSPAAAVLIDGVRTPIVGRIAMDMLTVDLAHCRPATLGGKVVLWGSALRVDEVAAWASTITYELLCKISARVPRVPQVSSGESLS